MKNVSLIAMIFLAAIVLTGCFEKGLSDKKLEEAETFSKHYISENYDDIGAITFTEHETNPMGILMVRGYINEDENQTFSVHYDFSKKDITGAAVEAEMTTEK